MLDLHEGVLGEFVQSGVWRTEPIFKDDGLTLHRPKSKADYTARERYKRFMLAHPGYRKARYLKQKSRA